MPLLRSFKQGSSFSTDIASLRVLKFPEKPESLLCVISTAGSDASLQINVSALVADGKDGDGLAVLDLEKRNMAGVAEQYRQFMVALLSADNGKITASIPDQSRITDK